MHIIPGSSTMPDTVHLIVFAEVVVPELTVHWHRSYYSASEADGSVVVCAELSTLQFEGSVQVHFATFGDSAKGNKPRLHLYGPLGKVQKHKQVCIP